MQEKNKFHRRDANAQRKERRKGEILETEKEKNKKYFSPFHCFVSPFLLNLFLLFSSLRLCVFAVNIIIYCFGIEIEFSSKSPCTAPV